MTKATMALTELAEKGPDVDVLRQMIQFVAQRLMDLDVETLCGAGYDVKSSERANSRNGYEAELKGFGNCFTTEDMKEGATAFLEKRKAVFTGK